MEDTLGNYGMKLNENKTKVMSSNELDEKRININIKIEKQVQIYCYLGSKITEDGKSKLDTINRIAQRKRAFQNKNHLQNTQDTRNNFLKIYV